MTTKLNIENDVTSNGDVHLRGTSISGWRKLDLAPGEKTEVWITDSSLLTAFETWPSAVLASDAVKAGVQADDIIASEVARQDKMWGVANERANSSGGQLLRAGLAQMEALMLRQGGEADAFGAPPNIYPEGWSGFRDYGSDVANLAVAAAYIRQEMKRLIAQGADTTRTSRDPATQPYTGDQPAVQL